VSRSTKVFGRIAKSSPDLVLCGDMLVISPTEHIVRGFLLETTTERDHVYLWRVVTPLLRPIRHIVLDYSVRIPNGEKLRMPRDGLQAAADNVSNLIAAGHIEAARAVRRPEDFLRHVAWIERNDSILLQTDLALVRYVAGYTEIALEMFRTLEKAVDRLPASQQPYIGPIITALKRQADADPAGVGGLIDSWERANVERLGLEGSR
jgi:hypothetical protein